MAAAAVKTVLKTVKPHVPLIKFPARTPNLPQSNTFEGAVIKAENKSNSTNSLASNRKAIDSAQLPFKYRRKPLTDEEIEIIEKGGLLK
ncbi:28S ribosomal protein S36, mitochondrial [Biomphalaria glabrata]|nr:28S ribosomal protein S36, mitochondrial [Biomphalaria glabrata]